MKFSAPQQVDPNSDPLFRQQRDQAQADRVKSLQELVGQDTADIQRRYGTRAASSAGAPAPGAPTGNNPDAGLAAYLVRNLFGKMFGGG